MSDGIDAETSAQVLALTRETLDGSPQNGQVFYFFFSKTLCINLQHPLICHHK
jgi:hypothetical protein